MSDTEVTHAYLGRMKCGCAVAVCIDNPSHPKQTQLDIEEMRQEGYSVERLPIQDARDRFTGCDCVKVKKSRMEDLERVAAKLAAALVAVLHECHTIAEIDRALSEWDALKGEA